MAAAPVEASEAQLQLERILSSTVFRKAQRSQRFLRYLVEFSLSQPESSVKEYVVALDVFDRAADYDPAIDATVRVEASRLRQRLREYYEEEGQHDPVLISIPKGSYQAVVRHRPSAPSRDDPVQGALATPTFPEIPHGLPSAPPDRADPGAEGGIFRPRVHSAYMAPGRIRMLMLLACVLLAGMVTALLLRNSRSERAASSKIRSLAVLTLRDLSPKGHTEYFADGLTHGLSEELSAIPDLKVVTGSPLLLPGDTPGQLSKTAGKLAVDAIVYGTVRRTADQVVLDLHVFDARSQSQLWDAQVGDALTNVPALQRRVAAEVALHASLPALAPQPTTAAEKSMDPSAFDGYLQGRYLLSKRDFEGSVRMFRRAVVLDPGAARSWAGLAAGTCELAMYTDPLEGLWTQARAAARHAIELDPGNGEAWSVLGEIAFNGDRDWKAAEYDLERATVLSPNDSTTESRYAILLSILGRTDEAVRHMQRALSLDPLSFFNVRMMGSVLYWSRRYDESLEYLHKAEELEPELAEVTLEWEVNDYQMKGLLEQAVRTDMRNFDGPGQKRWHDLLATAYRSGGRKAYWEERAKHVPTKPSGPCIEVEPVGFLVFAGENDRALDHLNRALEQGCFYLNVLKVEPSYDPLRGDPRYQQMLSRINLSDAY